MYSKSVEPVHPKALHIVFICRREAMLMFTHCLWRNRSRLCVVYALLATLNLTLRLQMLRMKEVRVVECGVTCADTRDIVFNTQLEQERGMLIPVRL